MYEMDTKDDNNTFIAKIVELPVGVYISTILTQWIYVFKKWKVK